MSYEEFVDFIANRMSMSHIYQPLLIRTLVESGVSPDGTIYAMS